MRANSIGRRRIVLALAVAAAISPSQPNAWVLGAESIWDGVAPVGNIGDGLLWTDANNWNTNGSPDAGPASGDDVKFANAQAIPGIIDLGGNQAANSLSFNSTGYTLGLNATTNILTVGSSAVSVSSGLTGTVNAVYAGTNGLALTGGGTLILNRATGNTFTGNITVDGAGTTLAYVGTGGSADPTALGSGAKSVTLTNGAVVSIIGASSNPTNGSKTFVIGAGGGTFNVGTNLTFQLDDAAQFGGTGSLTKTGAGILHLDEGYTYSGTNVNVNEGTLRVVNAGDLGSGNAVITVANGATFDIRATLSGTKPITVGGPGVANGGALIAGGGTGILNGAVTLTTDTSLGGANPLTLSGVVSDGAGSFNLTKVGTGTLVLSNAANDYGGTLTISGGAVRGAIGTSIDGNIILNGGAIEPTANFAAVTGTGPGQVQIVSGTASGFSSGLAAGITVSLDGAATPLVWGTNFNVSSFVLSGPNALGTLNFQNSIDLGGATRTFIANAATSAATAATLSGAVTGTGGLTKTGSGVLVLGNGGNSYSGTTLVSGGVLRGTLGSSIPSTGNLNLNGGALETGVNVTADLGAAAGQVQISGGTSGFSAFGGPVVVNVGGAATPVTWGSATFNPSTLVLNAASANNTLEFVNPINFAGTTRTVQVNANTATISGVISTASGTAGLTKNGNGVLVLSAANTYNGTTTLSAGSLSISSHNNLGTGGLTFDGGTLQVTGTAVNDFGTRTTTFVTTADRTIGFDIADPANTFTIPSTHPLSVASQNLLKAGAGTLVLSAPTNTVKQLFVNGGTLELGTTSLTVSNGGGNTIIGGGNATINGTGGGTINLPIGGTNYGDNFAATGTTLTINAKVTGAGGFEYYGGTSGTGNGTIVLANPANDYTLNTQINSANGNISVPGIGMAGVASPLGKGSVIVFNAAGARLIYTGIGETTDRTLSFGQSGIMEQAGSGLLKFTAAVAANGNTARTITLSGSTAGSGEIAGTIGNNGTGATSLAKSGTGTWIVSGANTYTGGTTVNAGTLLANATAVGASSTGTGAVTVNSGGTVGGIGTIAGALTINRGGKLAPGASIGTLSVGGAVTLGATGTGVPTLEIELGESNTSDLLQLTGTGASGTLTLSNADVLNLITADTGTFTIARAASIVSTFDTVMINGNTAVLGNDYNITYTPGDGTANSGSILVNVMAVPEPGSAALLGMAAVGLLARRRRTYRA